MAQIKYGTVTVTVSDEVAPPPEAGHLTAAEMMKLPRPMPGVGLACVQAAQCLKLVEATMLLPPGISSQSLGALGRRADHMDDVMGDLLMLHRTLGQAQLMFEAHAFKALHRLHMVVALQARDDPALAEIFAPLLLWFEGAPS